MVASNYGYPDPDNPPEDVSPNNDIIIANDTDNEEEENAYGYELLPSQETQEVESSDSSDNDEEATGEDNLPPIVSMENTLVKEVWEGPAPHDSDIVMDSEKVDEVKKAMINFTLPPSSIPAWANNIPEEQWKQKLVEKLQHLQNK